jgi:aminomethyltransferase
MRTPLYEEHVRLGARIVPFAGWDMPVQYEGILAEHRKTRSACTVFDTCHMGEFELSGPSAEADLERLLTQRVATIRTGQCRYGYLLRDDGGVLDDLTCYRFGPDRFWLIVNAGTRPADAGWVRERVSAGTEFRDLSEATAKIDVQGPASRAVVEAAFALRLPDLGYFRFAELDLAGVPCVVSRTGYTGEWGYEVYFSAARAADFWNRLLSAGASPAGLGARDTLRLEVGYPLYGHELGLDRSPVAASRGSYVDPGKEFIGRAAVVRDLEAGCPRYLAGLRLDSRRAARAGDRVTAGGAEAGVVTSGSYAPSVGAAVAMAYVDGALAAPGTRLAIESRGASLAAEVVGLPFWTKGTARGVGGPG